MSRRRPKRLKLSPHEQSLFRFAARLAGLRRLGGAWGPLPCPCGGHVRFAPVHGMAWCSRGCIDAADTVSLWLRRWAVPFWLAGDGDLNVGTGTVPRSLERRRTFEPVREARKAPAPTRTPAFMCRAIGPHIGNWRPE